MTATQAQPLWTRTFLLLCTAQFFGSAQHALLQPTFPLYITSLGGTPFQVGLVLACFAVTSVVFRPMIGAWADSWSEAGVSMCGLALLSAAMLFCFIPFAPATMFANALRGLGWAAMSAAGYSMLALSAPPERRGEASGYYSGVQASGTILLPAVALWLIAAPFGGFTLVYVVAIVLAATGALTSATLKRLLPKKAPNPHAAAGTWWQEILTVLDREIILASILSFASHVTFPHWQASSCSTPVSSPSTISAGFSSSAARPVCYRARCSAKFPTTSAAAAPCSPALSCSASP
jgi:MFS family permease